MQYKTMVLDLLQDRPSLYEQLRSQGSLLSTLDQYAIALRTCHKKWEARLAERRPRSESSQLASEALELALEELTSSLPGDETTEPLSLDAAMSFIQRHSSLA
jgi:hypothetical protein